MSSPTFVYVVPAGFVSVHPFGISVDIDPNFGFDRAANFVLVPIGFEAYAAYEAHFVLAVVRLSNMSCR